ncbi:MAG: glutamate--tRNA ligase [Calditrichia bacterium]
MSQQIRTRFAPSPTGYLHVGGLLAALFNYLYARKHEGVFILRIEDTDQSRFVQGAMEKLMASLKWSGIAYDEGPDIGGDMGPYIQSQRTELYKEHAEILLKNGYAYRCFCTPEELETMREKQLEAGEPMRYDGTWRDRDSAEVDAKMNEGASYVVRLKMPADGETVFSDLVRGEVRFMNELFDDQVLVKSDGFPTYHLANVVDDHHMGITHVIRGEEWLNSVPKHLQLYKAFGWQAPEMAHLSLLLNADRSKLSKRQGDVAVEDYRDKGYLPEALVNFVALLGWSPGGEQEIFSMGELIDQFSIDKVSKSGSVFDQDKLSWMNGMYIREMDQQNYIEFAKPFLQQAGLDVADEAQTNKILLAVQKKVDRGDQIPAAVDLFYSDTLNVEEEAALDVLKGESTKSVLELFLAGAKNVETLDLQSFKEVMKGVQQESGVKGAGLWQPMRVAITGMTSGPELPVVIDIFGKEKVCSFVEQAVEKYV